MQKPKIVNRLSSHSCYFICSTLHMPCYSLPRSDLSLKPRLRNLFISDAINCCKAKIRYKQDGIQYSTVAKYQLNRTKRFHYLYPVCAYTRAVTERRRRCSKDKYKTREIIIVFISIIYSHMYTLLIHILTL